MAKSQGNRGGGKSATRSSGSPRKGAGGWPSKTPGKPSGGGRTNAPAKGGKGK